MKKNHVTNSKLNLLGLLFEIRFIKHYEFCVLNKYVFLPCTVTHVNFCVCKWHTFHFSNIYSEYSPLCSKWIYFCRKKYNLYHSLRIFWIWVYTLNIPNNKWHKLCNFSLCFFSTYGNVKIMSLNQFKFWIHQWVINS